MGYEIIASVLSFDVPHAACVLCSVGGGEGSLNMALTPWNKMDRNLKFLSILDYLSIKHQPNEPQEERHTL